VLRLRHRQAHRAKRAVGLTGVFNQFIQTGCFQKPMHKSIAIAVVTAKPLNK